MATSIAAAQGGVSKADRQEAVRHFKAGSQHYKAGDYAKAASELEKAHALDPDSGTLTYNLARVYELMGDLDNAIRYYELYANKLDAQSKEHTQTQETLARLTGVRERERAEERAAQQEAEAEERQRAAKQEAERQKKQLQLAPRDDAEQSDSVLPTVLIAGAGVLAVGAVASWLVAGSARSDANDAFRDPDMGVAHANSKKEFETFSLIGDVAMVAAVASATVGVVLLATGDNAEEPEQTTQKASLRAWVAPTPRGAALGFGGMW